MKSVERRLARIEARYQKMLIEERKAREAERRLAEAVEAFEEQAERESPGDVAGALTKLAVAAAPDLRDALLRRARELRAESPSNEVH